MLEMGDRENSPTANFATNSSNTERERTSNNYIRMQACKVFRNLIVCFCSSKISLFKHCTIPNFPVLYSGEMNFWAIPDDQTTTVLAREENGTTSAVSTATIQIKAEDDGAIYKCETTSDALSSWEELPFDHVILDVFCE